MSQEFHYTFRISMGTETHVEYLHVHRDIFSIDLNKFLPREYLVPYSSRHAVARDNYGIFRIWRPLFESLKRQPAMKHTRGGEEHHGLIGFDRLSLKFMHVLKVEHVLLNESPLDLFICPIDKQLVVEVSFRRQPSAEKYGVLQICPMPVSLKENAELLSSAKSEHGYQHLSSSVEGFVNLLQKLSLSGSL